MWWHVILEDQIEDFIKYKYSNKKRNGIYNKKEKNENKEKEKNEKKGKEGVPIEDRREVKRKSEEHVKTDRQVLVPLWVTNLI